jgi:hypothetical protein
MSRPEGFDIESELTPQSIKLSGLRLKALSIALGLLGVAKDHRRQILGIYMAYIEFQKEKDMYSAGKTVLKGLQALLISGAALSAVALGGYLADSAVVIGVLQANGVNALYIAVLVPLVTAGGTALVNFAKNYGK